MTGQALSASQSLDDAAFAGLLPGSDSAGAGLAALLGNLGSKGSGQPGFAGKAAPTTPLAGGSAGVNGDFSGSGKKSKKRGRTFDILDDSAAARKVAKKELGDLANPLSALIANLESTIDLASKSSDDFPKAKADCIEMKKIAEARVALLKAWIETPEVSY